MLLESLKGGIVSVDTLARTDPSQKIYIETDCSKDVIVAVFLQ